MIRIALSTVLIVSFCHAAVAQTTKPAAPAATVTPPTMTPEEKWAQTVESFAKALVEGDLTAAGALVPKPTVRRFDSSSQQESWRIFDRVDKSTLVGQHAYLHPPLVMAADVAADFKNATTLPEEAKTKFVIDDETEIKRANATAAQWICEQLSAGNNTPVGVIVLWTPRSTSTDAAPQYEAVFVLCRGEEKENAQKAPKINSIVYGTPVADVQE
jgi:hypothetical protein